MRRLAVVIGIVVLSGGLSACVASPDTLSAIPRRTELGRMAASVGEAASPYVSRDAKPPSGFLAFCDRNPGECLVHREQPSVIVFTDEARATLEKVNVVVNNAVHPVDDSEHYGMTEFWTIPIDGEGDCEDYVLAKRKMLVLLGLPAPALRITVALRNGIRHAVLTVVTDRGDYVLDNMRDDILAGDQAGYIWVERQDPSSRTGWVALN